MYVSFYELLNIVTIIILIILSSVYVYLYLYIYIYMGFILSLLDARNTYDNL